MISKHIRHYLTAAGKQFFPEYIEKLKRIRPDVLGFVDILVGQEQDDTEATHLILQFVDAQGLERWNAHHEHFALVQSLRPYLRQQSTIHYFTLESVV